MASRHFASFGIERRARTPFLRWFWGRVGSRDLYALYANNKVRLSFITFKLLVPMFHVWIHVAGGRLIPYGGSSAGVPLNA